MQMDESFLNRGVNEGFSGGEKKRNEILQMARARAEARDARRDRLGPRHRRAEAWSPHGVNEPARPGSRDRAGHPLPAPARLHRAGLRARAVRRAASSRAATARSRSSSRSAATTGCARRRRWHERRRAPSPSAHYRAAFESLRDGRGGHRRAARGGLRALRHARLPSAARRGLEVHQPAAPRVAPLRRAPAAARRDASRCRSRSPGIASRIVNGRRREDLSTPGALPARPARARPRRGRSATASRSRRCCAWHAAAAPSASRRSTRRCAPTCVLLDVAAGAAPEPLELLLVGHAGRARHEPPADRDRARRPAATPGS